MSYPFNTIWKLECEGWQYLYTQDRCNNKAPEKPGVYCFASLNIDNTIRIMYVGKSSNFKSRLKFPHPIETKTNMSLLCFFQVCESPDQLEIDFIKRYRPELNKQHNG